MILVGVGVEDWGVGRLGLWVWVWSWMWVWGSGEEIGGAEFFSGGIWRDMRIGYYGY